MSGTGKTTKQMIRADKGAYYVWVDGNLWYPTELAKRLAREDLTIVSPAWLALKNFRGREALVVIDHAFHPRDNREREAIHYLAQYRLRGK